MDRLRSAQHGSVTHVPMIGCHPDVIEASHAVKSHFHVNQSYQVFR